MQHIFDIHDYDENFLEQFTSQSIPIFGLWSIRPLQNEQRELISGTSDEVDKFRNFITDHANKDYPHPLVIVIGNAEKSNPNNMSNTSKRYFKIKFDKYKGTDLGSPLAIGYPQKYEQGKEQIIPLGLAGLGQRNSQPGIGMQGVSYQDIQGIVDRNVADATRSIKAQYEEASAKREAEAMKKFAELEMRMELNKLDMREREIAEKERRLQEEMDDLEQRKLEGLGSVKEYTKTIAGGLLEVGKTAFGIDDKYDTKSNSKEKSDNLKGRSDAADFDDDGFVEKGNHSNSQFENLLGAIRNLDEDQKYALLDVLMPEEIQEETEQEVKPEPESTNQNNEPINSDKDENV